MRTHTKTKIRLRLVSFTSACVIPGTQRRQQQQNKINTERDFYPLESAKLITRTAGAVGSTPLQEIFFKLLGGGEKEGEEREGGRHRERMREGNGEREGERERGGEMGR